MKILPRHHLDLIIPIQRVCKQNKFQPFILITGGPDWPRINLRCWLACLFLWLMWEAFYSFLFNWKAGYDVAHLGPPALRRLRQEDWELKASLGYLVRCRLETKQNEIWLLALLGQTPILVGKLLPFWSLCFSLTKVLWENLEGLNFTSGCHIFEHILWSWILTQEDAPLQVMVSLPCANAHKLPLICHHTLSSRFIKGGWIHWNWSYEWLGATTWVLAPEPRSSVTIASALNCWASNPAPVLDSWMVATQFQNA